jgi:hypothetical protein
VKSQIGSAVLALAAILVLAGSVEAQEAMRAGLWQFTARDQSSSADGTSFTSCLDPARSVPTDPSLSCKINGVNRNGANVSWSMTCTVPQGVFTSQAVAQYRGGTMDGTMTTYVPMIGGQMSQRISGRYLGPCTR